MNNYYGSPLSREELRDEMSSQHRSQSNQARSDTTGTLSPPDHGATSGHDIAMSGGDSLDEIIRQNTNELHRRRSVPQPFPDSALQDEHDRRLSMMGYGHHNDSFTDYHFSNMNTSGDAMGGGYGNMTGTMTMPGHSGPYSQPNLMAMSNPGEFTSMSSDVMGNMMAFSGLNMGSMSADPRSLGLYSPTMDNQYGTSGLDPVNTEFDMDLNMDNIPLSAASTNPGVGLGLKAEDNMTGVEQSFRDHDSSNAPQERPTLGIDSSLGSFQHSLGPPQVPNTNYQSPASGTSRALSASQVTAPTPVVSTTVTSGPAPAPAPAKSEKTIYSKSGFDMLRALWYVATRKNATIQLGAVDMSCAFVVCDVTQNDCPIIYVSDNFQNLTGYSRHEIAGKNCRFLQSPDGIVEAGSKREFVENDAVLKLKTCIHDGKEIQQSLINYRKGGKPFLNLLTMVPIPWDTDEIRFFIGFQIDLLECPNAITGTEGGVVVDYLQNNEIEPYIWTPPLAYQWDPENGQTLGIDDVSALLKQYSPSGAASDWHKQSWEKMLLENTDDVIHVLSLKGVYLYTSPSIKKVLEYDSNELMGTNLASVCHPSDIVPVTREFKEAQGDVPVSIVYRIRRKHSGYVWFESHGSLYSEQGKGRKCLILVGRKRPVYILPRTDLEVNGGIGDSEIWTKISVSGMFLFVSSSVRSLLDLQPSDLVGKSMQELMRKESRAEFGRTIEKARKGSIVGCKHEIQNKRGQVLQAYTTFYPADITEGQKPAFLLAQTKLHRASSRTMSPTSGTAVGAPKAIGPSAAFVPSDDAGTGNYMSGMGGMGGSMESTALVSPTGTAPEASIEEAVLVRDDNLFEELKTTRCTSWQYELRQMEKNNRILAEELARLLSNKKKRKRRKGSNMIRDCANCHTRNTPEWRRGPSGNRDLCNSCGLRWAKQTGRVSPRNSSRGGNGDSQSRKSNSPSHSSPLQRELPKETPPLESGSKYSTTVTACSPTTIDGSPDSSITMGAPGGDPAGGKLSLGGGGHMNPPPSQPMLEGGSGLGGGGMEMTLIREEREASA